MAEKIFVVERYYLHVLTGYSCCKTREAAEKEVAKQQAFAEETRLKEHPRDPKDWHQWKIKEVTLK